MLRLVRPTLKACGCCFQFQITLKAGIVSSESGESSWRKFGLGQAALCYCALWGGRRQRFRLLVCLLLHLKKLKSKRDWSLYHLCQLWCLALRICPFKIVVQVQQVTVAVTTSGSTGCFFYRICYHGTFITYKV